MAEKLKIAIIGGGIAGLATAYHLEKYNFECTVYEKSGEVGGRFSTRAIEGVYINRGALMFCPQFNPCFLELIGELGIEYEQVHMSKFALQVGERLTPLDQWSIAKSGLFTIADFIKWFRLKRLLRSLDFDFERPDERLLKWHEMSLLEFCRKEAKLSDALIDYFIHPFSSFAYVDPDQLAADYGLFLLSYSITPCAIFAKGMEEVALGLKNRFKGKLRLATRVRNATRSEKGEFTLTVEEKGREGIYPQEEGPYHYSIFATGQRSVKNLMPEVDFEIFASKTRGIIFETVTPRYHPYELLIFPKTGNTHGVHGGELRHLPDGRSICGIFLHRADGDISAVFSDVKVIERLGWSPAISVTKPGAKLVDVTTNVKNVFTVGDFFRFPSLESCVYTAKKAAGIVAKECRKE